VKRKNGSLFDARLYVSPLVDARGQQTGWMTSMTDITEPTRIREQLQASHERFTTVLEALDASVSVTPLGSEELLFAPRFRRGSRICRPSGPTAARGEQDARGERCKNGERPEGGCCARVTIGHSAPLLAWRRLGRPRRAYPAAAVRKSRRARLKGA